MSRQQSGEAWENKLKGKTLLLDGAETTLGAEEVTKSLYSYKMVKIDTVTKKGILGT